MAGRVTCVLVLLTTLAAGEDWPQFRGPSGDGISRSANPPLEWSETKNIAWKTAIPGRGRSSPVVLGDRVWLTTAIESNVVRKRIGPDDMQAADHVALGAACLDRTTGRLLWHVTTFDVDKPPPVHWLNSWATPTPVAEPERLYCDFGSMGTACLDAETGKTLWTQRLPIDHMVGPGSSPILCQNLLILVRDGCDQQYVAALDKKTGETVWKTPRPPIEARPDLRKAFSTPLLIERDGTAQMIAVGARWAVCYEPATGKELWRVRHGNGWSLAPRPVADAERVYICTGAVVAQLAAIRLGGEGDVTPSHIAWRSSEIHYPIMPSPILVGKELYCVNDEGIVLCLDAATGQVVWRTRLGGPAMASPVFAAGRLYFWTSTGKSVVLKAGRQLERLAENALEGTLVASPAIVGDAIFLRTDTHLYRIENR
ncbi:MAG TPA: PQQ-binding-like beta-propeller repeat protein [Planctomycetota bacterium]|nr:PQQ-binding-like beta-propeller repeat protein [Planctomycetota bacterium]HRR79802.1 PQQ-binding-like beta-propeller repeat protein [Planctomycetota bacterium]HRT94175.1 PQQ-binding-like beta-propeller repeat protein [Planctomycetota bacterium]